MDKPHLTLVDPNSSVDYGQEFVPLPYYPWDSRPETLALDQDECATAIHLAGGDLPRACELLKVPMIRLSRSLRHSPRLQRILEETTQLAVARAASEYLRALDAPDDRRREWGATRIMQSRAAMGHPFSPAPAGSAQSNVTINQAAREIVFSWRNSPGPVDYEQQTVDSSRADGEDAADDQ